MRKRKCELMDCDLLQGNQLEIKLKEYSASQPETNAVSDQADTPGLDPAIQGKETTSLPARVERAASTEIAVPFGRK